MTEYEVATTDEVPEGERVIVDVKGREIAVFNHEGSYFAYLNWCPHQAGPLCEGRLTGTITASFDRETLVETEEWIKDDEILMCPWHGWEFDLISGDCLSKHGLSMPSYDVTVKDDTVVIDV